MGHSQSAPALVKYPSTYCLQQKECRAFVQMECPQRCIVSGPLLDRYWQSSANVWAAVQKELKAILKKSSRKGNKQKGGAKKLAVVFDIDDTLLWTSCPVCKQQDRRIQSANPLPVEPILELFLACRHAGLATCLVSARREAQRDTTTAQLAAAGLQGYTELLLVPEWMVGEGFLNDVKGVMSFKVAARQEFIRMHGGRIVACVGDQAWDVAGPRTGHRELVREPSSRS
mmetsp:Transcript_6640/g.15296  ORF Transcript_6640/g.15296 Transcript_6640/m.15296 type:complete len:229 (+) Transcript_6640:1-687(+)